MHYWNCKSNRDCCLPFENKLEINLCQKYIVIIALKIRTEETKKL